MNGADFKDVMNQLVDYYGDKAFSPHARSILWRILSPLSRSEALRVIELVAEEHSRAPSIAAIKKAAAPYLRDAETRRQRLEIERLEQMREGRCQSCDFTGYVLALSRADLTIEYSFRCPSCPAARARRIDERIQQWSDELKTNFIPVSFRNESHEAAKKAQRKSNAEKIAKRTGQRPAGLAPINDELARFAEDLALRITHGGVAILDAEGEIS